MPWSGPGVTQTDICLEMTYQILRNAKEAERQHCYRLPGVSPNLTCGRRLSRRSTKPSSTCRYYVTELVIACGAEPPAVGANRHFVEAVSIFQQLPAKAKAMEEAAAQAAKAGKGAAKAKAAKPAGESEEPAADEDAGLALARKLYDDESKAAQLAEILKQEPA